MTTTTAIAPAIQSICGRAGVSVSDLPTAVSTVSGTNTASRTATVTSSSTSPSAQETTTNAAVANVAGMGVVAVGFAAYFL